MSCSSATAFPSVRPFSGFLSAGAIVALGILIIVRPAGAAYPGANGKIIFGSDWDRGDNYGAQLRTSRGAQEALAPNLRGEGNRR